MKKKPKGLFLFPRFLSSFLIAGQLLFSLSSPSFALRPIPDKAGLEEKFKGSLNEVVAHFERLPLSIERGLSSEIKTFSNSLRTLGPWITEIVVEQARFDEPADLQIIGSRAHIILSEGKPKPAKGQFQELTRRLPREIEQSLREGRTYPGLDSYRVEEFLKKELWPWLDSANEAITSSAETQWLDSPVPEDLVLRWRQLHDNLLHSTLIEPGQLPSQIGTWRDLKLRLLGPLNEKIARPAGYFVAQNAIIQLDRHRVSGFLEVPYHLTEGTVMLGQPKRSFSIGLTAVVLHPLEDLDIRLFEILMDKAREARRPLSDAMLQFMRQEGAASRWAREFPQDYAVLMAMVPYAMSEVERVGLGALQNEGYRDVLAEEEFHVTQHIAGARLLGLDPREIEPKLAALPLLRPIGATVDRVKEHLDLQPVRDNIVEKVNWDAVVERMYASHSLAIAENTHLHLARAIYLLLTLSPEAQIGVSEAAYSLSTEWLFEDLVREMAILKNGDYTAVQDALEDPAFVREAASRATFFEFYTQEEIEGFLTMESLDRAFAILRSHPSDLVDAPFRLRLVALQTQTPIKDIHLKILKQATGLEETLLESQRSFRQFVDSLSAFATGA